MRRNCCIKPIWPPSDRTRLLFTPPAPRRRKFHAYREWLRLWPDHFRVHFVRNQREEMLAPAGTASLTVSKESGLMVIRERVRPVRYKKAGSADPFLVGQYAGCFALHRRRLCNKGPVL